MGWLLKYRKKDNKYRIWTTISDEWICDWSSEKDIKRLLASIARYDYKKDVIKMYMSFPANWADKDTHKIFNIGGEKAFYEWILKIGGNTKEVNKKYREVMKELTTP